mmetsp:Transcript_13052/g.28612  ORF Transcript_13052/g.28612 Transcript_13052/m.28612 type:complete len:239 (+) Transcript_13052:1158-1874(+)
MLMNLRFGASAGFGFGISTSKLSSPSWRSISATVLLLGNGSPNILSVWSRASVPVFSSIIFLISPAVWDGLTAMGTFLPSGIKTFVLITSGGTSTSKLSSPSCSPKSLTVLPSSTLSPYVLSVCFLTGMPALSPIFFLIFNPESDGVTVKGSFLPSGSKTPTLTDLGSICNTQSSMIPAAGALSLSLPTSPPLRKRRWLSDGMPEMAAILSFTSQTLSLEGSTVISYSSPYMLSTFTG